MLGARKFGLLSKSAKGGGGLLLCTQIIYGDRKIDLKQIYFHEKLHFQSAPVLFWRFSIHFNNSNIHLGKTNQFIFLYYKEEFLTCPQTLVAYYFHNIFEKQQMLSAFNTPPWPALGLLVPELLAAWGDLALIQVIQIEMRSNI